MEKLVELISVICGLLYLVFIIKENNWCWPFGIIGSLITVYLYFHHKLYLEAGLNGYYVLAGVYGWVFWTSHRNRENKTPVRNWQTSWHVLSITGGLLLSLYLGHIMHRYTDSPRPYVDAAMTVFSFIATYMEARKVLTGWYYWFILNGTSVWLQLDRGLYMYAALSVFTTLMCIKGYMEWKKSYQHQLA
ncbi:nicotinamide riboside transporter PnuC [Deminuibacter soli]|uniref:Nicotinamide riboside transporter PnuC n=1 Tax=Deminuibacter soli TaxID=2291815 RepID=A0A3E1NJQ2_9BACT|nr:nicotinamide riboside transporter PnuC [Deminuibacter soli]RFM28165.1 nicotinamide riboside transporter PnuC [Deminuibacter soli]